MADADDFALIAQMLAQDYGSKLHGVALMMMTTTISVVMAVARS